jgi:serine protease Do
LVNLDGELIGINTAIASRSGGSQGLGFAIPVNMVKTVMEALIKDGRVSRGFLGITLGGEVDQTMAKALGLPNASGFVVGDVEPGGPAEDAGLQGGDVIVSLNGNPVKEWLDFRVAIASLTPGSEIELEIYRDGKKQTVDVVLGERDADAVASIDNDDMESLREELGFSVTDLSDAMRGELQLRDDVNGVVVDEIDQTSMAYRQGLRNGDVITVISGERIENTRQFYDSMISFRDSDEEVLLLKIIRQGRNIYVAFELVS